MQPERAVLARAAGATVVALGLMLTSAMAASAATPSERLLIPSAGWHGRPIEEPHRHDAVRTAAADRALRGWSAGPVSLGTGRHRPSGSIRVREVQRRLRSLGYRPGPIDGIFGPRTQAAVGWFQYKHGLHVDGRATLITVRHLRARTSPSTGSGPADPGQTSSTTWASLRELVAGPPRAVAAADTHHGVGWLAALALVALAFVFGAAAVLSGATLVPPRAAARSATHPRRRALAYVREAAGERGGRRFEAQAAALEAACVARGIELWGLVSDDERDRGSIDQRPGLVYALEQFDAGEVDYLVVDRVDDLSRSLRELRSVLAAMAQRTAPLVVLNLGREPVTAGGWAGSEPERPPMPAAAARPHPRERSDA